MVLVLCTSGEERDGILLRGGAGCKSGEVWWVRQGPSPILAVPACLAKTQKLPIKSERHPGNPWVNQGSGEMSKLTVAVTACIFAVAFGASQTSVRAASSHEASIRALENRLVAAVNAKDVSAIMKVYVPDESLFVFDVVPPRQYVGAKAYAKDWTDILSMFNGPVKFEISSTPAVGRPPFMRLARVSANW
jgi:hypothetical protein